VKSVVYFRVGVKRGPHLDLFGPPSKLLILNKDGDGQNYV